MQIGYLYHDDHTPVTDVHRTWRGSYRTHAAVSLSTKLEGDTVEIYSASCGSTRVFRVEAADAHTALLVQCGWC